MSIADIIPPAMPDPAEARALRMKVGLSLDAFAKSIGVTQGSISRWELGQVKPHGLNRVAYLDGLNQIREILSARESGDL